MTRTLLVIGALAASLVATLVSLQPAEARGGPGGYSHSSFGSRGFSSGMRFGSFNRGPSFNRGQSFNRASFYRAPSVYRGSNFVRSTYHRPSHSHRFHHRHFRHAPFFFVGYNVGYGYDYGYSCQWLRWKAAETGSRYWWDRYYDCIGAY
jgi:hypothetical protein